MALAPRLLWRLHSWRLDRRLARDPQISREELREYQWSIGAEPAAVSGDMVKGWLWIGTTMATALWLDENGLRNVLEIALAAGACFLALQAIWRWQNDPDDGLEGDEARTRKWKVIAELTCSLAVFCASLWLIYG